jgi:hypothetical protein
MSVIVKKHGWEAWIGLLHRKICEGDNVVRWGTLVIFHEYVVASMI